MKYKTGDRIKKKKRKSYEHDDYEILSTFTSDKCNGYIIADLYDNSVTGIEDKDFDIITKLSSRQKNPDDAYFKFVEDRYLRVKKQVMNHKDVINPKFDEM